MAEPCGSGGSQAEILPLKVRNACRGAPVNSAANDLYRHFADWNMTGIGTKLTNDTGITALNKLTAASMPATRIVKVN